MKKIISVLLAIVIMCSFTMIAFAADNDTITEGKTSTYTVSLDSSTDLSFVPNDTGIYKVEFAFKDPSAVKCSVIEASIYYKNDFINYALIGKVDPSDFDVDDEDNDIYFDFFSDGFGSENEFYFVAEKGKFFTLELDAPAYIDSTAYDKTTDVTVKIEKADAPTFEIGKTYTANPDTNVYYAAPKTDTIYNITSASTVSHIELNDINGTVNSYYFDESEEINYTFKLTGGKAYAIVVYNVMGDSISFTVNDGSKVLPQEIQIVTSYGLDSVVTGGVELLYIRILPYGSEINTGSNLEYTVADEEIATVEYDEGFEGYIVYAHKAGTTTVTFTEPVSGATGTFEIKVITRFQYFISNIPYYIFMFFYRIANFFSNLFNWG